MATQVLHPKLLGPGDQVGSWRIVEVVGSGGFGRVFKVERNGLVGAMKMALQPASEPAHPDEEDSGRRMAYEVAALLMHHTHPNMVRVLAMDRWPDTDGYLFVVTDYVEGDTFHEWRWREGPTAARFVDVFSELVRAVGELHRLGVLHRDIKSTNVVVRRADGKPFLIDFGVARLPGTCALTKGLPPGAFHLLSPEAVAFGRAEGEKPTASFDGGVPADLYALGVLLYESLADVHPFDPKLPDSALLFAIENVKPKPPHEINPRVPEALSDIALRLLEKKPEERYPSTEALLEALEEAARERESPAWQVPLCEPEKEVRQEAKVPPEEGRAAPSQDAKPEGPGEPPVSSPAPSWRGRRWMTLGSLLLLALVSWLGWATLRSPDAYDSPEKGNAPVSDTSRPQDPASSPREGRNLRRSWPFVSSLCLVFGLGCSAAQVAPERSRCPEEVAYTMFRDLELKAGGYIHAVIDIHQPGTNQDVGLFKDGPLVGRVIDGGGKMPAGTLLYGRIWTGPGIIIEDFPDRPEAVIVRYEEALLPDGRKFPVCMVAGGPDGRLMRREGSKPGAARVVKEAVVSPVWVWP